MFLSNEFPVSGLGDRIMELYLLCILTKIYNNPVHIVWREFQTGAHKEIVEWRKKDTQLEFFLSFFTIPLGITLSTELKLAIPSDTIYIPNQHGYATSINLFFEQTADRILSYSEYIKIVEEVKQSIQLRVPEYQHAVPFCTVHLRRTDKLTAGDNLSVGFSELDDLNARTKAAILKAKEKGFTSFFLASDDPAAQDDYAAFLKQHALERIEPPNTHDLILSYYDIWVMKSSSLIIQSMKFSTFSLFPSVIWNIPLWTVYKDSPVFTEEFDKVAPIRFYDDS